jgi:disulfide oxidoreductase YuzD
MLKTPITLADLCTLPVGEIMNLLPSTLLLVQKEATEAFESAKLTKEWLENAIRLKYDTRFQALRQQHDKPFGTVHLDDDGCTVTCDVPKKPEWDQQKLAAVVHQISAAGDNPAEYVDVTYKVAERKFTAWPEHIRQAFAPARVLKAGKATVSLKMNEGGQP